MGAGADFKAMNQDNPHAEELYIAPVDFREQRGCELSEAQGADEMKTNRNANKATTDEAYYVSAADLADKIIVLMQQGSDPLLLSTSTWALVQTSQCQAIN